MFITWIFTVPQGTFTVTAKGADRADSHANAAKMLRGFLGLPAGTSLMGRTPRVGDTVGAAL